MQENLGLCLSKTVYRGSYLPGDGLLSEGSLWERSELDFSCQLKGQAGELQEERGDRALCSYQVPNCLEDVLSLFFRE